MNVAFPTVSGRSREADPSDEILLQGIVERCPDALRSLYTRYEALVITIALHILLDPDDAQEIFQDVFLLIWNHAERFDARRGKVKGWISGVTRCRAIDRSRRLRREAAARETIRTEFALHPREYFSSSDRSRYLADIGDDGRAMLLESVTHLPSEQMQVLLLTYMTGMSQREIARHLGLTFGVVKHRLNMAMRFMAGRAKRLRGVLAV